MQSSIWCPYMVTNFNNWVFNTMTTRIGEISFVFIFTTYYFVPPFVNSLTIGAMSLERYLLICHPTTVRQYWFFKSRKLVYTIVSVVVFVFPISVGLFQAICFVSQRPILLIQWLSKFFASFYVRRFIVLANSVFRNCKTANSLLNQKLVFFDNFEFHHLLGFLSFRSN